MLLQISLVVLLALLNGFFALSEMALMVARKSRLKHLAHDQPPREDRARPREQPESFLATVQVFITLLQVGAGASLGARSASASALRSTRSTSLARSVLRVPIGVVLAVSGITFIQMLLGELLPKRVALVDPERFAIATALPMRVLTWLASPFAFLLIRMTRGLLVCCA